MASPQLNGNVLKTRIIPVNMGDLGRFRNTQTLEHWELPSDPASLEPLREAAEHLKHSNIPVGFPTETVYGLGAQATRSDAVKGIYKAKGRPSDNPLIIHVSDLTMLRNLLSPTEKMNGHSIDVDPVPEIYKPLIKRFWPGPLTILLPNPSFSKLAPEVTAGLPSFGARMPNSPLAQSLIHLAGAPLAAPSANASTKPSPTAAQHVKHDLDGKIEIILDGGPCQVGVESTVVDGMCDPPVVLRPGGVSIDEIRQCEGWGGVVKAYKDQSEIGSHVPRAPGMKYKHYSPKANVVLYEALPEQARTGIPLEVWRIIEQQEQNKLSAPAKIGIVSTKYWKEWAGFHDAKWAREGVDATTEVTPSQGVQDMKYDVVREGTLWFENGKSHNWDEQEKRHVAELYEISFGPKTKDIAHGLFSALRELDQRAVDVIYVEGIEDEGDIAAAVMNRLRKAATVIEK